jgi:hypothetical protein
MVTWLNCNVQERESGSDPEIPGDLMVRILKERAPAAFGNNSLGAALGDEYATVWYGRITDAWRPGIFTFQIMGRTMAHEIGHLLLGPESHASAGAMRPAWTYRQFGIEGANLWFFTPEQNQAMRAEVYRRTGEASSQPIEE